MNVDWEEILQTVTDWAMTQGAKILFALVILFVSFRIINLVSRIIQKRAEKKKKLDKTVVRTMLYVGRISIKIAIGVGLIGYVGIDTSGLAALIAAGGVAIGLAINGALGNIAGGVLILLSRPYRIDDFIEVAGYMGTVEDIHLVATLIRTPDNKQVVVPNGTASTSVVVNYSRKDTRRVDLTFPVGYGDDRKLAQQVLTDVCSKHEKVLADPAPTVRVMQNGPNSVELVVRVWVKKEDYWDVYFDLTENGKTALDEVGITIPYQQLDVHIKEK